MRAAGNGVKVTNKGEPASSSQWPMLHLTRLEPDLAAADVILVDYSVNDFNLDGFLECRDKKGQNVLMDKKRWAKSLWNHGGNVLRDGLKNGFQRDKVFDELTKEFKGDF